MPRRVEDTALHVADCEAVALGEEPVELRAAAGHLVAEIVDVLPLVLDLGDVLADTDRRTDLVLDVAGRREVIGMGVGLEQPLDLEPLRLDMGEDGIRGISGHRARGGVVVEHRVDDRAFAAARRAYHIGDRVGGLVEESLNFR